MQILFSYLKRYWKLCLLTLFLASINQIFSLLDPYIFRLLIDQYVTKPELFGEAEFFRGVGLLLLGVVGVAFVSRVAKNFQDYYLNSVSQRVGADLYRDGIEHSLELPYEVFEDERSGETLSKLQKARTDSERLIASFVNVFFITLIGFLFVAIYALSVYWAVALVFIATVPLISVMSLVLSKKIKQIQKAIVAETTALSGSTTESLRNIELVKALGLAGQEVARLNSTTDKILGLELKKLKYLRSLSFIQGTMINLLRTGLVFFMIYLIYKGLITFGEFFSLLFYSFYIFNPLQEVGNLINIYRETEASFANYKKVVETPVERKVLTPEKLGAIKNLTFDKVSFTYKSSSSYALDDIVFEIKNGETVAFVGPSGSGKTSIMKLLLGLYDPSSGEILYNNISHAQIDKNELRSQVGLVTQDTQLFSGSIRENLTFVNPKASDLECLEVLAKAQCQNILERGGQGLDTLIGEGGVKLSGGEKQRLSIARALLRNPNLLIFDEATSALDSITEEEISKTIRHLSEDKEHITVLVAHRLSTIMHSDKIYVLEKGKVVESGTHNELVAQKGLYYAMWREQIGERE